MTTANGGAALRVTVDRASAEAGLAAAAAAATDAPVVEVGSTGVTGLDPLVAATLDGTTAFHANCTPDRVRELAASLDRGELPAGGAHAVVDHDPDAASLPTPAEGPLSVGTRRALGRCGWADPAAPVAAEASVADADPEAVLSAVRSVGLLGRGRGDLRTDEPLAAAWSLVREADGDPVVVVNGNEADPANDADRTLLEGAPAAVLDAAAAVAGVVGAADVVCYLNESETLAAERVSAAVERADVDPAVQVVTGPDAYIAGEMTMALEAMEGNDRLEARLRPPTPAEHGLYGRPTAIHTPRTLAQVREATLRPAAFDADDADPGTRVVTVAGDVAARATVELPTGGSLDALREAVDLDGRLKMACVGGQFGGLTRTLDHPPSAPALRGARLGSEGAVELLSRARCAVATAGKRARFAHEENCGRCVPCREGSTQLTDLLRAVYDGDYDDGALRELARVMRTTSTCDFGQAAARPVTTAMDAFETEFVAHAEGRCPSGACDARSEP